MKSYVGDSVYADFDGLDLTLTTENGYGPSNTIVLEPAIWRALLEFMGVSPPALGKEFYPAGWPRCKCGRPALDGKATCGLVECQ